MTKILVISYFFPPCTLTASNRVFGLVSKLNKFGIYPVVITRHWNDKNDTPNDLLISTKDRVEHFCYEGYEVYYLPYKSTVRDRILVNSKNSILLRKISKLITLVYLLAEPLTNYFVPFSNLYTFSKKYLYDNKDIKFILVSANPFVLFKFGYHLSKHFKIPWIADYRDSWTTNKMAMEVRGFNTYLYKIYRYFERKWVNTAAFFTSVSDKYVDQINQVIKVKGYTIYNGFTELKKMDEFSISEDFTILYAGNLYYNQPIESFIQFLKNNEFKFHNQNVKLVFAGLGFDEKQSQRVLNAASGFENHIQILGWLTNDEYITYQLESDLLLMLPYQGFTGIPSSKLFDYLSTNKNILLYNTDNDIIERILKDSKLGFVAQNNDETYNFISKLILCKKNKKTYLNRNVTFVEKYSMEYQAKILSELIIK